MRNLSAALISQGSKSSLMTAEAMRKYFSRVDMLQLKNVKVSLGKESGVYYEGKPLDYYDCVYIKGSFRYANLQRSIALMLEGKVPYMPFPANSFTVVHNKLLTHLILQQHNIPMPKTFISPTTDAAKELLGMIKYPLVMKFPQGTQGKGVMFADTFSSASSLLDALGVLNQPFIVQEYVETGGTDVRALVVGDKVVAAMRRRAQREEKRANIHAGGNGELAVLDREAVALALKTARILEVDICGVDMLEGSFGPVVIEANLSPGVQGINEGALLDLPDEIAKFLFKKTEEALYKKNKQAADEVMKGLTLESKTPPGQKIITDLKFRGERIILPEWITKITGFNEQKEYIIKAGKGRLEVEENWE
ncbi:MAG: RimK family alpha-L-glutamate ligase [Nanoarchaeota archaeon]